MMENKFTPRAEESLRLAQEAAEEMGHGYVGSEHLLLGLMREEEGIAHRVLEEAGLTDDMICDVLHRSVGTGLSGAAPSQGLTPRAKSAVEWFQDVLDNAPEVNLYMEYSNKTCQDNVLRLFRDLNLKVLNMEITRSTETETHNACALFTLRLNKRCRVEQLIPKMNATEGVVSVEEL